MSSRSRRRWPSDLADAIYINSPHVEKRFKERSNSQQPLGVCKDQVVALVSKAIRDNDERYPAHRNDSVTAFALRLIPSDADPVYAICDSVVGGRHLFKVLTVLDPDQFTGDTSGASLGTLADVVNIQEIQNKPVPVQETPAMSNDHNSMPAAFTPVMDADNFIVAYDTSKGKKYRNVHKDQMESTVLDLIRNQIDTTTIKVYRIKEVPFSFSFNLSFGDETAKPVAATPVATTGSVSAKGTMRAKYIEILETNGGWMRPKDIEAVLLGAGYEVKTPVATALYTMYNANTYPLEKKGKRAHVRYRFKKEGE